MLHGVKSALRSRAPRLYDFARGLSYRARGITLTPLTPQAIAALVRMPDPTILEIGCNDGSDTLRFLNAMPAAKLYCFEPDPRAIARFKTKLGAALPRVRLFEGALSDRGGQIEFHVSDGPSPDSQAGWDLSGSIRRPKNHVVYDPAVRFEKTIPVNTCRLDDWCAEHGIEEIDFIWMDVQGAEGDVISGATRILKRTRFLYTEYSNNELYEGQPSLTQILAALPAFEVRARYPYDVLLENRNRR